MYIGQTTTSAAKRWKHHVWSAHNRKTPKHYLLGNAIRKHGQNAFVVEQIDVAETLQELNDKEKYWIATQLTFGKGYNMTEGGNGIVGLRREKHGMWGKGHLVSGDKNPMYGRRGELHHLFGTHPTQETLQKMKQRRPSVAGKKNSMYGKPKSESTKEKIRLAKLGKCLGMKSAAGKWFLVTSPNGKQTQVRSLMNFCREQELSYQSMQHTLVHGQPIVKGLSKGWKAERMASINTEVQQ